MTRHTVVRQFEVQASDPESLKDLAARLREAGLELPPPGVEVWDSDRFPIMSVRVTAPSDAVARIRDLIRRFETVTVRREWMDAPTFRSIAESPRDAAVAHGTGRGHFGYPDPRALARIDPKGRSRGVKGSGAPIVVAVVDSGLDVTHATFVNHLWRDHVAGQEINGFHCEGGQLGYDVTDREGHGTKLAGTILGTANHVEGLRILPVKFYDAATQPLADNAARAINVALDSHVDIINLSFDLGLGSNELLEAFRRVRGTDTLIVIAAGNTGSDNDRYPLVPLVYASECREQVISVMATDLDDRKPVFSNFGRRTVDLAAPGVDIVSTQAAPFRGLGRYTGTSAAAATVAGAAALLKSQNPHWSAQDIKTRLTSTVEKIRGLKCETEGRLDLGEAL